MRVAVDATPLYGHRTGVGVFTRELIRRTGGGDIGLLAYAVTWRGRGRLASMLPPGVLSARRSLMPARPVHLAWHHFGWPPIEAWTGPVDLVHGTNFVVPPTRRAARLVTVHDLSPWRFPEAVNEQAARYPAFVGRAVAAGAHVHVHARFVADEVCDRLAVPPERVHVVAAGIDEMPPGDPLAGVLRAGSEHYVLALGTVEPRKDLPSLVRAFDIVAADRAGVRLVVAGPDGWGVEAYDAAVHAARHRDRIVRLGWVDDQAKADLLAGASVFAYPSRYEGFGLPPLEAMSVGTPVVATTAGALPEVCGDGADLVAPGDELALASALARVIGDGDHRAALAARGRRRAADFSWDRCAEGLRAVYAAVVAADE
jgi:glycosyltransferase involved in cell wall biosynthesis